MPKPPPRNRSFRSARPSGGDRPFNERNPPNERHPSGERHLSKERPAQGERPFGKDRPRGPARPSGGDRPFNERRPPNDRPPSNERFPANERQRGGERPQGNDRPRAPARESARPVRPERAPGVHPTPSVARNNLLYGVHPVSLAWLNPDRRCRHLYATESALAELAPVLARASALGLSRPAPIPVERDAVERMLPTGAVHQGLALDAEPLPEMSLEDVLIAAGEGPACIVVLDQVTDPHNVGAILRSAASFGAKAIVVQRRHAPEVSGVLAKAASGAVDIVPIVRETNLSRAIESAHDAGFYVLGLDENGKSIAEAAIPERVVLVMGAEGAGIRRLIAESCDLLVRLPTTPPIGSLNVSNAAAVALYEVARRRAGST